MGSGKSTVSRKLSEKISLPLLDMDKEIEKIMDMPLEKIFKDYGESRFRLIESTFFRECTKNNHFIYATGGGIVLNNENQDILKTRGISIFLDCNVDTILFRIKNKKDNRPLFNNKNDLKELYNKRKELYKDSSHHTVNVNHSTPDQIVKKIIKYINE